MNNDIIDKIIHNVITETLNKSYRYNISTEIPKYIDDWDYDAFDDDSLDANISKLSAKLHKDMSKCSNQRGKSASIMSELEKLGFKHVYYRTFDGGETSYDTELSFSIIIYSPYNNDMYCARIWGKTIKPNKNGKYLTRSYYSYGYCSFKQKYGFRSDFDYKDVKDLVINKYIKNFLLKPNTVNVHFH